MNQANRILVIGDAMIDTYIYGKVERISPESPVPVLKSLEHRQFLGGAGNVARNAAALGGKVSVIFAIGNDEDGDRVIEKLDEWGICPNYIVRDNELCTINKTRIVGNGQQIVRVDYNDRYVLNSDLEERILSVIEKAVSKHDIIIISDYGKGMCSEKICKEIIRAAGKKPVLIDPKGINWEKYRGAAVITPNLKEMNQFSGMAVENESAVLEEVYNGFNRKLGIRYLLLTRSEEGMSLFGDGDICHISVYSHQVYDVSGAGDTVIAALAVYLHPNMDNIREATKLSNIAAGLVVAKPGTAVVTKNEIQQQLAVDRFRSKDSKIFTVSDYEQLKNLVNLWRTGGNTIVTTNGCFDIIHRGHIKLLQEAKNYGDKLIVAINSDASVKRLKGEGRPVNNELDRAYVVSAIDFVDAVVIFDPLITPISLKEHELEHMSEKARKAFPEAPMALMKMISPDIHVKGGDYQAEDIPEAVYAEQVEIVSIVEGYSTTNVINSLGKEKI